ncbi:AI-2E family transporter [Roseiconus nitratireducens]|uniref:AI-2E family transporter n=1 Tax=Roseiconus nitratireducens TaxID=2605748 RepID=A0A5M6DNV8_9BACT|nr:AI-2E family transporter [Roseiconus nitratireducens]KAA5547125.1 AI-2E family transporter [Roseiconus nitratireducens]
MAEPEPNETPRERYNRLNVSPITLKYVTAMEKQSMRLGWIAAGIWLCGILLVAYTLYIGRNLFVPIAVATFAYLTVRPLVRAAQRLGVPPPVSAAVIVVGLALLIGGGSYMLSGPAKEMMADVPQSLGDAKKKLSFIFDRLETVNEATENITEATEEEMEETEDKPVPVVVKQPAWTTSSPLIAGTGNFVSFMSIAIVLFYFLTAAGEQLIENLLRSLPTFRSKRQFIEILNSVQDGLSHYLAWVTAINIALGCAIGTAMWLLGMPSPVLWGVAGALLNFIPIVGAVCGVILAFFVALVNFEPSYAFLVAGTYMALTTLEGQFITPSLLGKSMRLSSVLVFLSIVLWGWMWGMMGVFLAVPILIAVTMISERLEAMAPISAVLSGGAPEPPETAE